MQFLWLAHAIPYPPKAGFLIRSYHLLRELAREHTVDVVAMVQKDWVTTLYPTLAEGLAESHAALAEFCRDVHFAPIERLERRFGRQRTALEALLRGTPYATTWLESPQAATAVREIVATRHPDLVHFDTIGLVPLAAQIEMLPSTLGHHNVESHMLQRRAVNTPNPIARAYLAREARLLQRVEIDTGRRFATHVTCSDLDSDRLRELLPGAHIESVPNGVDCGYFCPNAGTERPNSLVFAGTMNWYPNVDAMLFMLREIWPALRRRVPDLTLDIVGSNPPDLLRRFVAESPGVTMHGYVPDVRPYLAAAGLVVCPIRDGGGTKLKILDAFASGKCVLAHPIACEGIDVTDGRDIVLATEPAQWVERCVELLAGPARRREIAAAARALVETRYSYASIGRHFRLIMTEAAARGAGR